jgi:hypothetical protein
MFAPGQREAKVRYRDGRFDIVVPGEYVICKVTHERIPLDQLRYWSVDRQEPYVDAYAALRGLRGNQA